jgi:hypothetical protein
VTADTLRNGVDASTMALQDSLLISFKQRVMHMMNTRNVANYTVLVFVLIAGFSRANAHGDDGPSLIFGLETLNAAQRETVDRFVLEHEQPAGELKVLAERPGIVVRSSVSLRRLFPHSRFVVVPWNFQLDPAAKHLYSVPGGIYDVLAINDDGLLESIFHSSGNHEEFGVFLNDHRVKVKNKTMACDVSSARADIYGSGLSLCNDVRPSSSEWRLSYTEMPFRPISSYEEVREAYYYRLELDSSGVVLNGTYVCEILERRKIANVEKSSGVFPSKNWHH